jgi:hypothetical protein
LTVIQQSLDNVKLLMQRFVMSCPLSEQDLEYLSTTLLVVLGQQAEARLHCLLVAPTGALAQVPVELEPLSLNPGILHLTDTVEGIREKLCLLRELGYTLVMYRYSAVEPWIHELDTVTLADQPTTDPYGLMELNKTLPKSHIYCELFGGSAPLLCCREPSAVEVVNDRRSLVVDFMQLLRHVDNFNFLVLLSRVFPFSIQLDQDALRQFVHTTPRRAPDVVRGFSWYRMMRESYRLSWSQLGNEAKQVLISDPALTQNLALLDPYLPSLHGRLMRIQYENNQYHKILASFDSINTLFWVDVPLTEGPDDNAAELVHTLQQLEQQTGHVVLYWRPNCSNQVLSSLIHEGLFSTWQQQQLPDAVVYTKPAS